MSRLPTPGSDNGTWGEVLNDYLGVIHNADGTLRSNAVDASAIQANSVSSIKLQDGSVTNAKLAAGTSTNGQVLTADSSQATGLRWGTSSDGVTPINGGGETFFDAGNSSTAITLDLANGNVQRVTLTANCTVTLTNPAAGAMRALTLLVFQDGVGSRTITWPGSVNWGNAGTPVLTTTIGKMDMISLFTVNGGTVWYGALGAKGF